MPKLSLPQIGSLKQIKLFKETGGSPTTISTNGGSFIKGEENRKIGERKRQKRDSLSKGRVSGGSIELHGVSISNSGAKAKG